MAADAIFNLRNRLLGSAKFRSMVQKIPLFQRVGRRRAIELFRLLSGFVHTQVALSCLRLGLFETLEGGPLAAAEIARRTAIDEARLLHLLRAAAALQLLERRPDGRYGLGILGATMIDNDSVVAMTEHHALFYADLADPVPLFTGSGTQTRMSELWPYAASDSPGDLETADVTNYTALMAASQAMVAEQVIASHSFKGVRSMLDIGGGAGAFAIAVARRWPGLSITVADLPAVADIARSRVDAAGLAGRIDVIGADVTRDRLPDGFDVVSLVRILHDHDDRHCIEILGAAREALGDRGTLLIAEPMADAPAAGRWIDAYFNVYLLAMGSGRPRGLDELAGLLTEAGFGPPTRLRTGVPLITSVVLAAKM